jgi:hypothetical protein
VKSACWNLRRALLARRAGVTLRVLHSTAEQSRYEVLRRWLRLLHAEERVIPYLILQLPTQKGSYLRT